MNQDKKALQILSKTYWSSEGWRKDPTTEPDRFRYACEAGYMFDDAFASLSHDELVKQIIDTRSLISVEAVSNAFLTSLSSRRLELRSALGSFAVARNLPNHLFGPPVDELAVVAQCAVCGASIVDDPERNILNFERYKWGGVRHLNPQYIQFDLQQFEKIEVPKPNQQDISIFQRILDEVRILPPQFGARDLEKRLAKVLPSNRAEREILIQILCYCGILSAKGHLDFFNAFPTLNERPQPPYCTDWNYPSYFWRASDGLQSSALQFYFPLLRI